MNSAALGLMDALKGCADFQCYDVPGSIANYYQCIQDFCPAQYSTCMSQGTTTPGGNNGSTGNDNTGSGNAGTGITSCLDVHEAVLSECVPTYSACVAACFDENCANTCSGEIAACIQGKQNAAPALEAANFGAVLSCRQANFNACNGQADALYMTCESACGAGDNACITQCGADSDAGYEACYEEVCANEYAACGITANGSNPTEGGAGTDPTEGEVETNAPSGDGTLSSCLAIYEAVQSVCDADYVACQSVCNDPPCADQCAQEANACVDTQLASAEKAEDAADYEAVLGCWNTHYDTCFGEGSAVYSDCMATCTDGEAACSQACNVPATEAYAGCYNTACADVYATCGIE
jgi:hypothetical protein